MWGDYIIDFDLEKILMMGGREWTRRAQDGKGAVGAGTAVSVWTSGVGWGWRAFKERNNPHEETSSAKRFSEMGKCERAECQGLARVHKQEMVIWGRITPPGGPPVFRGFLDSVLSGPSSTVIKGIYHLRS